jgi:hypothetical protein
MQACERARHGFASWPTAPPPRDMDHQRSLHRLAQAEEHDEKLTKQREERALERRSLELLGRRPLSAEQKKAAATSTEGGGEATAHAAATTAPAPAPAQDEEGEQEEGGGALSSPLTYPNP